MRLFPSSIVNAIDFGPVPIGTVKIKLDVTGTDILQLPVNCVLIGDQPEEKKSRFVTDFAGVLKGIFGE